VDNEVIEKTPEQIEQEMLNTRESLTQKVAALEQTVMGTIQNATDTVSDSVDAVKTAVSSAPSAMKETVESVKESVREAFDISSRVREQPWLSVGIAAAAGFFAGLMIPGGRRSSSTSSDAAPEWSRDQRSFAAVPSPQPESPGIFDQLFNLIGKEVRQMAEQAISTASASIKETIGTEIPKLIESAVPGVESMLSSVAGHQSNGVRTGTGYASRV